MLLYFLINLLGINHQFVHGLLVPAIALAYLVFFISYSLFSHSTTLTFGTLIPTGLGHLYC